MNKLCIATAFCTLTLIMLFSSSLPATAQPGASQLADEIERANASYLSGVERVSVTIEGDMFGSVTSHYVKAERDGVPYLRAEDDEYEFAGNMSFNNPYIRTFITGASSITNDNLNGRDMYRVYVDDPSVFDLMEQQLDFEEEFEDEMEFRSATAWIGQDDYLIYRMEYEVDADTDGDVRVVMIMEDYQSFDGLPFAMKTTLEMHGWRNLVGDEEFAEGMEAMEEMLKELENLPEAQREMIMKQMGPQLEQYKQMMEGDGPSSMVLRVVDVQVNP
jgi:hypothetical protein